MFQGSEVDPDIETKAVQGLCIPPSCLGLVFALEQQVPGGSSSLTDVNNEPERAIGMIVAATTKSKYLCCCMSQLEADSGVWGFRG